MNSPVQSPLPDPIEQTLVDAVLNGAIEVRGNPTEGSLPWMRFHAAVDRYLAHRAAHVPKAHLSATLFDAIQHGDDKHRAWLRQAIDDHFAGRAVLRPDQSSPKAEPKYQIGDWLVTDTGHRGRFHSLDRGLILIVGEDAMISAWTPSKVSRSEPLGCRPPAEYESEPFHFLTRGGGFAPAELKDGFWWICGLVGCLTPLEVGRSGWSWHSLACSPPIARPSTDIEHIADARKEVEFDEEAAREIAREHFGIFTPKAEILDRYNREILATFKPLPAQVQVEATEEAILAFCRAQPGWFDSRIEGVPVIRAALAHFRPARTVSDGEIVRIAKRFACTARDAEFYDFVTRSMLIGFARALLDGASD